MAVISCILFLLPACSLGAVMCGTMGGGCGGLCPDRLRTPSQKSDAPNTAARILLRLGTQVYVWFMYIVVGSHFYTSISLSLYAGVFLKAFGLQCFQFLPQTVVFLVHRVAYFGFILGGLAMAFGSIIFLMASPLQRGCRDLKGPEYTFFEKVTITQTILVKPSVKMPVPFLHAILHNDNTCTYACMWKNDGTCVQYRLWTTNHFKAFGMTH